MDSKMIQIGARKVGDTLMRNSPTILTGLSVAGLVTTVVMAVGATPKALCLISEEEMKREDEFVKTSNEPLPITKMDVVKLTWKCYIPTVAMGVLTAAMMVGANSISLRRNAALATVYSLAERSLEEYQRKVVETLGDKEEEKLRGDIAQDRLKAHPVDEKQVIITGKGEILCYDSLSGRYFKSSMETVRKAQNDFNFRLMNEMYRSVNEFYDLLGLEPTATGNEMGWATDFGLLDIHFDTKIASGDYEGQPCLVLDYKVHPRLMG